MLQRMSTARALFRGNVRSFEVCERNGFGDSLIHLPRACDRSQRCNDLLLGRRNDGRQERSHACGKQLARKADHRIRLNVGRVEIESHIAIDLKIDEAWGQPQIARGLVLHFTHANVADRSRFNFDLDEVAAGRVAAGEDSRAHKDLSTETIFCINSRINIAARGK